MDYAVIKNTLHSIYVRGSLLSFPAFSQHRETRPFKLELDLAKVGSRLFSQLALILLGVLLEFPKDTGGMCQRNSLFSGLNPERTSLESEEESQKETGKAKGQGETKREGKREGRWEGQ